MALQVFAYNITDKGRFLSHVKQVGESIRLPTQKYVPLHRNTSLRIHTKKGRSVKLSIHLHKVVVVVVLMMMIVLMIIIIIIIQFINARLKSSRSIKKTAQTHKYTNTQVKHNYTNKPK